MNHIVAVVIIVGVLVIAFSSLMYAWHEDRDRRTARHIAERKQRAAEEALARDQYLTSINEGSIYNVGSQMGKMFAEALNGRALTRQPSFQEVIDRFS